MMSRFFSLGSSQKGAASFGAIATLGVCSVAFCFAAACSNGGTGTGGTGGTGTTSSTSKTSSSTTGSSTTSGSTTSSTTSSSSSGQGGQGGAPGWPTCDTQPPGSALKTLPQVWTDNPASPTPEWIPGAYVIGVSGAGCVANMSCQIFIQQDETYANLTAAQQHAIKIDIIPAAAVHFTGIAVGDKVDVYGQAFRDTQMGANELKILVSPNLQGCAKKVGTGNPVPVTATLDQLTVDLYETQGPLLITVPTVTGHVHMPTETFALWTTGQSPGMDITKVTSMSPFFLSGGAFTGLTPDLITQFGSVTGVFGIFFPQGNIKYEEIYIRSMAEAPVL